ncbi:MAG: ABC transporter, ATP-binding protein, partial [uncultured Gemmatimonadaceae bacterium]
ARVRRLHAAAARPRRAPLPVHRPGGARGAGAGLRRAGHLLRRGERVGEVHLARGDRGRGGAPGGGERRGGERRHARGRAGARAAAATHLARRAQPARVLPARGGLLRLRQAARRDARDDARRAGDARGRLPARRPLGLRPRPRAGAAPRVARRHGAALRRGPGRQLARPELPAALPVAARPRRAPHARRAR